MVFIFTIAFGLHLDIFIGILVGYMNVILDMKIINLSNETAKKFENKFPFKMFNRNSGEIIIR